MSDPVGSKQYRSIVVQESSERRLGLRLLILVLLVAVVAAAYWFGGRSMRAEFQTVSKDYTQMAERLAAAEVASREASQQLVNLKVGADVDRRTVNDVRSLVSKYKQTINQLNEEISFYKGLMAPTEKERGLGIRSWEVYPTDESHVFQYKLVLQQLALKHTVLKGVLSLDVVGKRDGKEEILSLDILSQQIDSSGVKLRFKYFQYVEGELRLPEGFTPNSVDIVARATAPKAVTVEKHYGWIVQNTPG
ncbi:MAG: DUF6776 family protein [Oceanicoccus sp.]